METPKFVARRSKVWVAWKLLKCGWHLKEVQPPWDGVLSLWGQSCAAVHQLVSEEGTGACMEELALVRR